MNDTTDTRTPEVAAPFDRSCSAITVGLFLAPSGSDQRFSTKEEAHAEAQKLSRQSDATAIAVWDGDELIRVYLRGYALSPFWG